MGASIECGQSVEVAYSVEGRDELDVVEIIQDGVVVHRDYPQTNLAGDMTSGRPVQLRLEWGWGPWADLALERVVDWEFEISVENGRQLRWFPCIQSGPFDEDRRHRFTRTCGQTLRVVSYTSRKGAYRNNPNQSLVLEISGRPETQIALNLTRPVEQTTRTTLTELCAGSVNRFVGPFPKEAYQWHRLVPRSASALSGRCTLPGREGRSYVYLRVRQQNGHMAWISPVFLTNKSSRMRHSSKVSNRRV